MKILYHHRTASKDGQDVHIEAMIGAMRGLGHEVILVAPGGSEQHSFGHDGGLVARVRAILPRAVGELLELAYSLHAYRNLRRAWARHRPDLLYERYNLFFLAGLWLKRRTGIPYLVEVNAPLAEERARHGGLALGGLARWCERAVWRGADVALPVTEVLAGHLRRAGVPDGRILVVPNGIDRARFGPAVDGAAERARLGLGDKVVLGFTGFMRAWHGLDTVIDAMAAMPGRERLHLLVAGDGPARADLESHARRAGLENQVTCLGLVERDRIPGIVAAFDIALQPRAVDYASPLKLMEYMGLGRAIVAPDQPNIREVLVDGETALLFPPDDTDRFRACITRLCQDDSLRRRLGVAAARAITDRDLTWEANARRVLARAGGRQGSP